jgi:hypothetical protein
MATITGQKIVDINSNRHPVRQDLLDTYKASIAGGNKHHMQEARDDGYYDNITTRLDGANNTNLLVARGGMIYTAGNIYSQSFNIATPSFNNINMATIPIDDYLLKTGRSLEFEVIGRVSAENFLGVFSFEIAAYLYHPGGYLLSTFTVADGQGGDIIPFRMNFRIVKISPDFIVCTGDQYLRNNSGAPGYPYTGIQFKGGELLEHIVGDTIEPKIRLTTFSYDFVDSGANNAEILLSAITAKYV